VTVSLDDEGWVTGLEDGNHGWLSLVILEPEPLPKRQASLGPAPLAATAPNAGSGRNGARASIDPQHGAARARITGRFRGRGVLRCADKSQPRMQIRGAHRQVAGIGISTRLAAGRTVVHVLSDKAPDAGFTPVEGGLEDVYFSTLAASRRAA